MQLLLFAYSFMTVPKRDVEHVTLQIFPRESTWLMLKHDYFASEAVSSDLPVLCSWPSSISNRSSYKGSSTNTVKLSVTLGWDHIPHSVVSWLLGRGIPRKRRKCCFLTLSFCKKAVGGKSFLPMCLCFYHRCLCPSEFSSSFDDLNFKGCREKSSTSLRLSH